MTGLNVKTQIIIDALASHIASIDDKLSTLHSDNSSILDALTALAEGFTNVYHVLGTISDTLANNMPASAADGGLYHLIDTMHTQNGTIITDLGDILSTLESIGVADESTAINTLNLLRNQQQFILCCDVLSLPEDPTLDTQPSDWCQRVGWLTDVIGGILAVTLQVFHSGSFNATNLLSALNQYGATFDPDIVFPASIVSNIVQQMLLGLEQTDDLADIYTTNANIIRLAIYEAVTPADVPGIYATVIDSIDSNTYDRAIFKALGFQNLWNYVFSSSFSNDVSSYPDDCAPIDECFHIICNIDYGGVFGADLSAYPPLPYIGTDNHYLQNGDSAYTGWTVVSATSTIRVNEGAFNFDRSAGVPYALAYNGNIAFYTLTSGATIDLCPPA